MNKVYDRVSSGGVIVRKNTHGIPEVLLLHRAVSSVWAYDSYHLPKGVVEEGESEEEATLREVLEETGYNVKIIRKLGSLVSIYDDVSGKGNKLTHYFLCEVIKRVGDLDSEHDNLEWVGIGEAIDLLSNFPIWEKEEDIIKQIL